jgi:two-component system LytT family sensor kinase
MVQQHLVILLVKLAVAASLASILTRSGRFQHMLMREERTLAQRVQMALVCAAIFGTGVLARVLNGDNHDYQALDLGLEGSLAIGMLGGYVTGLLAGVLISIPAMFNHELMTMPLFASAGVLGGLLRDLAPDKEAIWKFSPFPDLSLWRFMRRLPTRRDLRLPAFSLLCVFAIALAETLRAALALRRSASSPCKEIGAMPDPGSSWRSTPPLCFPPLFPSKSGTAIARKKSSSNNSCI